MLRRHHTPEADPRAPAAHAPGRRRAGERGGGASGTPAAATTTELALWQPDASHRRARPASLAAGTRASALPRRPRRRVPPSRRAGARGREERGAWKERSRARSRCAGAQAGLGAGVQSGPQRCAPRGRGPLEQRSHPPAWGKKGWEVGFDRAGYQRGRQGRSPRKSQDTFPCSPFGQLLTVSRHSDLRLLGKVS